MRFLFEDDIGLILVCFRGLGFGVSRFVFFEEMEIKCEILKFEF